jgi:hypothetical protein
MESMNVEDTAMAPLEQREAPYRFKGAFYEACDCYTICPCWTGDAPDEGECTGVFVWDIEDGKIDGIDVKGRRAVSVSQHQGHRDEASQHVVLFVDPEANAEQAEILAAALSGKLGGPLGQLAEILGELIGVERAEINLERQGRKTKLTVGRRIQVEGTASEGPGGEATTLSGGKLSAVLGSPAEVGVSRRFRVGLPAQAMDLDLRGRSTMSGRFAYDYTPEKEA